jgi:hypothetical protein
MQSSTKLPACASGLETVLIGQSATRKIDRMDDSSQGMVRTRVFQGYLMPLQG